MPVAVLSLNAIAFISRFTRKAGAGLHPHGAGARAARPARVVGTRCATR